MRVKAYNTRIEGDVMARVRGYLIVLMSALAVIQPAVPQSRHVIGMNQYLSDGARALEIGDYEEGIRLTLEGLKFVTSPRNRVSALNNLCAGYTANRQFDEAMRNCDMAIELDDRNWRIYNNRALAHLGKGRIDAAKRDLAKGLSLNPESQKLTRVAELIQAQDMRLLIAVEN